MAQSRWFSLVLAQGDTISMHPDVAALDAPPPSR